MKNNFIKFSAIATPLLAPALAFAQNNPLLGILDLIRNILESYLFPILIAIAILYFFWQVIMWIKAPAEEKSAHAISVLWSVVALFVLLAFWGIVAFIVNTTGIDPQSAPNLPGIPGVDN